MIVRGSDSAFTHVLGHQEEVIPSTKETGKVKVTKIYQNLSCTVITLPVPTPRISGDGVVQYSTRNGVPQVSSIRGKQSSVDPLLDNYCSKLGLVLVPCGCIGVRMHGHG